MRIIYLRGKIIPINIVACFLVSLIVQSDTTKTIFWSFNRFW